MQQSCKDVTIITSRRAEAYNGHNPLSFVYPPISGNYTRKRAIEQYRLPVGTVVELFDGYTVITFAVAVSGSSGIALRAARAIGAIRPIEDSGERQCEGHGDFGLSGLDRSDITLEIAPPLEPEANTGI